MKINTAIIFSTKGMLLFNFYCDENFFFSLYSKNEERKFNYTQPFPKIAQRSEYSQAAINALNKAEAENKNR